MRELRKELKNRKFRPVYLFYGTEDYLLRLYTKELTSAVLDSGDKMMNFDIFEGKDIKVARIMDVADTMPFMSDYRLIICKNTGLFVSGKKDESDKLADYLQLIPETTIIAFIEDEADKRMRVFKRLSERGYAVNFKLPSEKELIDWVTRTFYKSNLEINYKVAEYLIQVVPSNMDSIMSEMEKLIAYKTGAMESAEVKTEDINEICSKSLETRIFELVGSVGNRKPERALDIFGNMLVMKESPIMVITMIGRQFRLLLQCKYLSEKKASPGEIANALGISGYYVSGYIKQSKNFSIRQLFEAFNDCVEADIAVKTGRITDALAVENIIVKHSSV